MGVWLRKKTKDLSVSESEECGYGEGGCVCYSTTVIHYNHMVTPKQARDLGGLDCAKTKGPECQ